MGSNSSGSTFIPKKVLGKFMHISNQPLRRPSGKSLVFFMGAGFCPFCASERWAIVSALSNFGSWQGLLESASADRDEKYLNIPTFNFARAKYTSDYEILDTFNPDQLIPFLLIDGQFMKVGSGYSPQLLEGMNHAKLKAEVENLASSVGKAIKTEADNITALICKSIGGKSNVCNSKDVKTLADKI
ncbi:MAG TPA: DUF929 family protein [Nitrososphaera sp.]|nr:DUF929 family protein [Nitrososphaera sp.]